MTRIITCIFLVVVFLDICFSQAQNWPVKGEWSGSGLEVENAKEMPIWVIAINEAAKKVGLSDARIKTKCEFKMRQMKLEPVDFELSYPPPPYELMVSVQTSGASFLIELHFLRRARYEVGKKVYETYATTWSTNGFGLHGNDADFVLSALEGKLEEFLNDFEKTNWQ